MNSNMSMGRALFSMYNSYSHTHCKVMPLQYIRRQLCHTDVIKRFQAERKMKTLCASLNQNIKTTKKKIRNDRDRNRFNELYEVMEKRDFVVDNKTNPGYLYLSKYGPNGEFINVSIWKEDDHVHVETKLEKVNVQEFCMKFHCVSMKDSLGMFAVEVVPSDADDSTAVYGGRVIRDMQDDLKKAFMKYLESLGIDSQLAKFAATYCRQKYTHDTWTFLKNFKDFAVDDELVVETKGSAIEENAKV